MTSSANLDISRELELAVPLKKDSQAGEIYFTISGLGGHVITFQIIARSVSQKWRGFGLLYPGFGKTDNEQEPTVQSFAKKMLKEVEAIQPEGPYLFVGYSMGGNICLEMARLLKQRGKGAGVVLVDVKIYEHSRLKQPLKRLPVQLYWKSRDIMARITGLKRRATRKRREALLFQGDNPQKHMPESFDRVIRDGQIAYASYKLQPCDVPAVLIRCKDLIWYDDIRYWEEDYGWHRYVKLVDVIYSPGDHLEMMRPPNTQAFAERIEQAFEQLKVSLGY